MSKTIRIILVFLVSVAVTSAFLAIIASITASFTQFKTASPVHRYLDHVYVVRGFYEGSHCRITEHGEIHEKVFYRAECQYTSKDGKMKRYLSISVDESDLTIDETNQEP